jgi:endonuclease/exonuclease/phosphatase family metal-dependent hydrolase
MPSRAPLREIPPIDPAERSRIGDNRDGLDYRELLSLVPQLDLVEASDAWLEPREDSELSVLFWNGERGHFVLEDELPLPDASILLLNEMDAGMARTGNVHTVRELARRLGLSYAFGVEFLELTKGEPREREAPGENELGLHGNAVLAGFPVREPRLIRFSGGERWLEDEQKRLGGRMALVCTLETPRGEVRAVATHLESEASPAVRARQMAELLEALDDEDDTVATVIGGDLNTWTIDKTSDRERAELQASDETPTRLLRPMPWEPLFAEAASRGYSFEAANDLSRGTYPVPGFPIEARLDWILSRGLGRDPAAGAPSVIPAPFSERRGGPVSDHHLLRVVLELPS